MESPNPTLTVINSALNFVNLVLCAWIIATAKNTGREVKVNTRIAKETRAETHQIAERTNGKLDKLVDRLERAATKLATATATRAARGKKPAPRKKPKARGR